MTRRTMFSALALAALSIGTAAAQNPAAKPASAPKSASPKPAVSKPVQPATAAAPSHPSHRVRESKPGLLKQAKIAPDAAEQTAMGAVPGGTVTSRKIEMSKGTLMYAFNIKSTGTEGYNSVTVDATTGSLVANTHKAAMAAKPKPKPAAKKPQ
jgi:hypothetical protein